MAAIALRNSWGIAETWPSRFGQYPERERIGPIACFVTLAQGYAELAPLTVQQIVAALRAEGMPVAAIADAMRVERKTIYSWLDGGDARGTHTQRAVQVHSLLASVLDIGVRNVYRFWNTPIAEGRTLRDLICAPTINEQLVRSALNMLRPAAQKAHDSERKMSRKGAGNPVLDELPEAGS